MIFAEVFANVSITVGFTIIAYKKTKDFLLSAYYSLFSIIIGTIGNTTASIPITLIFKVTPDDVRESLPLHITVAIPTFFLCYIVSRYTGNVLNKNYMQLSIKAKQMFAAYACVLSVLTYPLFLVNSLLYRLMERPDIVAYINVSLGTFIFLVTIITIAAYSRSQQKQMEAEYKNKALEDLENHNKHLVQAYDEFRDFRHAHKNMLVSLMGFANDENKGHLKDYLIKHLNYSEEILKKLDSSTDRLKNIHIPEIVGFLSAGFAQALAEGIEVEIDIAEPVDNIPVNRVDLYQLVVIIVENALEEFKTHKKNDTRILKFGIIIDEEDILIICSNTVKIPPNVEMMFEKEYSTKGPGRGLGLYNLKKICGKCGNIFVTAHVKESEFSLILTVREI
jgi:two-component system sensor histidine kinase AgrC